MIWKRAVTLQALNAMGEGNMVGLLDIQFTRIGEDELEATMPVDYRTHQPFGLLHGGRRAGRNPGVRGGLSLHRRGAKGRRAGGEREPYSLGAKWTGARRLSRATRR